MGAGDALNESKKGGRVRNKGKIQGGGKNTECQVL